ncbi:DUF6069 family protein [Promicromonospora iranensis]|jgi:hypothetical protein|uniref:DUF6069 family protein n=1 Tax=Promicromonospora iranensis TaxID=1105144 RepID=UPI0023A9B16C|nr:DUF6069 family protein [Promicromonospora iranensis]
MAVYGQYPQDAAGRPGGVDARVLWSGGAATALVVALIALVGVVVFRGVFDIPILAPEGDGVWGDVSTVWFMAAAAICALLAVGLAHLLLLSTPRALSFFSWIVGLATVVAGVAPFITDAALSSKLASALINVVIGFAILGLVSGAARSAVARAVRNG